MVKGNNQDCVFANYNLGKENFLIPVASIGGEIEISSGTIMEDISESARGFVTDDESHANGRLTKPGSSVYQSCDEIDLYGDLEGAVFSPAKRKISTPQRDALEQQLAVAQNEIQELKDRVTTLSKENINLQKNFASLLKTAREDKDKNIFTLRELRNKLRHVTTLNAQHSSLPKEEIKQIFDYCNDVEAQLQSRISAQIIRDALEAMKQEKQKLNVPDYTRKWSKQIKMDNMTIYLAREQVPFTRLEAVTFPKAEQALVGKDSQDNERPIVEKEKASGPSFLALPQPSTEVNPSSSDISFANVFGKLSKPSILECETSQQHNTSHVVTSDEQVAGPFVKRTATEKCEADSRSQRDNPSSRHHSSNRNKHENSRRANSNRNRQNRTNSNGRSDSQRGRSATAKHRSRSRSRSPRNHHSRRDDRKRERRSRTRSPERRFSSRGQDKVGFKTEKLGSNRAKASNARL